MLDATVLKYKLATSLARVLGDPLVLAHRVRHLGDAYRRLEQARLAEPCYEEALAIYRQHREAKPLDVANALRGFAILKESVGAKAESRRLWQEAHDLYVKVDVTAGVAESAKRLAALTLILAMVTATVPVAHAQHPPSTPTAVLRVRRDRAMQAAADAIILIRSRPRVIGETEAGFRQEPGFLYLTGLANAMGALLVLDSRRHQSWLFVPPPGGLPGVGAMLRAPYGYVEAGEASAAQLGLDFVVPWGDFASFMDRRLSEDTTLVIRGAFRNDSAAAAGHLVGQDERGLWGSALRARWPHAHFGPAPNAEALRAIKDADEIAVLRRVATSSAAALRAGLAALQPGRRQREAEVDVVAACVHAGADRVSFWPWVMTGNSSSIAVALQSLADDRYLDRVMRAGELARVDVGCAQEHYEGDVGRTAPVSGRFDQGQREAWDLFVSAYRRALDSIKPGHTAQDVLAAWQAEFQRRRPQLQTAFGKRTADVALSSEGSTFWQMHGVGIASAEGLINTISAGQVLALEPILTVDGVGLYLEDMILVTPQGAEVLTKGLPYSAAEIEVAVRSRR